MLPAFAARDRKHIIILGEEPGESDLRGRYAFICRERFELLNPLAIGLEIFFEEPRELAAYVVFRLRPSFVDHARQKTIAQRRIGHQRHAKVITHITVTILNIAGPQGIFKL